MKNIWFITVPVAWFTACHSPSLTDVSEAIDSLNSPENIAGSGSFERMPANLPNSGQSRPVWTGHWWPASEGGTAARRGNQFSPMEKYDQAVGHGLRATNREKALSQRYASVSWAGHCNGLAAAGIMSEEPKREVRYNGVTFTIDDIKALLIEAFQNSPVGMAGGRCEEVAPGRNSTGRAVGAHCRDLNPGTFYLAVTNYLGLHQTPVIIDIQSGQQVWNYPVVSYSLSKTPIDKREAARLTTQGESYLFNPQATRFMKVSMAIRLATGVEKSYDFVIEGDSSSQVIGGEWIGDSKSDHPDFIWRPKGPGAENNELNIEIIKQIHQLSIR